MKPNLNQSNTEYIEIHSFAMTPMDWPYLQTTPDETIPISFYTVGLCTIKRLDDNKTEIHKNELVGEMKVQPTLTEKSTKFYGNKINYSCPKLKQKKEEKKKT